jgi:hypothetical protein
MAVLVNDSLQGCCQYTQKCATQPVMTHLGTEEIPDHGHIQAEKKSQNKALMLTFIISINSATAFLIQLHDVW